MTSKTREILLRSIIRQESLYNLDLCIIKEMAYTISSNLISGCFLTILSIHLPVDVSLLGLHRCSSTQIILRLFSSQEEIGIQKELYQTDAPLYST